MRQKEILEAAQSGELNLLESIPPRELNESIVDEDRANCLHYAARGGEVNVIQFLVRKRNFSETKRTKIGSTPLHDAAASGRLDVLKWFIENTSVVVDDQDGTGATILHLSARYGHPVTYQWLLDNTKCDPMKKAASGALPIHFAVFGKSLNIVKKVLQETPRTINLQMDNGATPVYLACQEGQLEILKYLVLQAGGSVKMKAFDGMSCLHAAAQNGHLDCVKWMVEEQKANPNDRDFDGATPLHYAASNGHTRVVAWLLNHGGAKVTLDNMGGSPLHNAAELGQLDHPAKENHHDQIQCVKCLLDNGCSADITDNSGLTASELAERCYNDKCAAEIKAKLSGQNTEQDRNGYHKDTVERTFSIGRSTNHSNQSDSSKHSYSGKPSTSKEIHQSNSSKHSYSEKPSTSKEIHQSVEPEHPPSITKQNHLQITLQNTSPSSSASHPIVPEICSNKAECILSGETGECESRSVSSECLQSQETGECESLQGTQLSEDQVDFIPNSPPPTPPPDYPSNFIKTTSEISSEASSLSYNSIHDEVITIRKTDTVDSKEVLNPLYSSGRSSPTIIISRPEIKVTDQTKNMNNSGESTADKAKHYFEKDLVIENQNGDDKPQTNGVDSESIEGHHQDDNAQRRNSAEEQNNGGKITPVPDVVTERLKSINLAPPPPPVISPGSPTLTNGDLRPERPISFLAEIQSVSLNSSRSVSPSSKMLSSNSPNSNVNHDFIAELKKATGAGVNSLKRTRKPAEGGQMTMVYSFGKDETMLNGNESTDKNKDTGKPLVLEGEFDPKNFMDKVSAYDSQGNPIPQWKKQMVARQLAEKTMVETLERRKKEEIEAKYKNMPPWKRALIEKKEAEAAQARLAKEKEAEEKKKINASRTAISGRLTPFESQKS